MSQRHRTAEVPLPPKLELRSHGCATDLLREFRDEASLRRILQTVVDSFGVEVVLRDVILPALEQVGDDWQRGSIDISQEHFVSNLIRGRLLALARLWGRGGGPLFQRPASSSRRRTQPSKCGQRRRMASRPRSWPHGRRLPASC